MRAVEKRPARRIGCPRIDDVWRGASDFTIGLRDPYAGIPPARAGCRQNRGEVRPPPPPTVNSRWAAIPRTHGSTVAGARCFIHPCFEGVCSCHDASVNKVMRLRRRVAEACREAETPTALLLGVNRALQEDLAVDRWCGITLDPAFGMATGGFHDEGVSPHRIPRLLESSSLWGRRTPFMSCS